MMSQFERFGKYILLEKLASGGMAEIYLSKSIGAQGVNKFLAIKRILPQYSENPEFKEMFREEAKVSVNLRHSNVVPIFDFGEERGQFYLVMDYVEGRNVRQMLNELKKQQVQLTIEQICYMVREAAAGLDHAHRCIDGSTGRPLNIIHRDISPQNIMVSFDGEVKIIDFGIAKAETQLEATKAGTLKGKFGYMSPEQSDGMTIDVRTDIFSLGIILWELLANDRLFTASSEAAILRKIRDCQIPPIRKINPSVPPELEKIVNKVLAKDPNMRYQTATALHKDLNRFLNTFYPDFNAQDFSIFIKNTFAQAFQESKQKLVDYSTIKDGDIREYGTPAGRTEKADPTIIDNSLLDQEEKLTLDPESNARVDLQTLKGAAPGKPGSKVSLAAPNAGVGSTAAPGMPAKKLDGSATRPKMPGQQTAVRKGPVHDRNTEEPSRIPMLAGLTLLVAAGVWAWTSGLLPFEPPGRKHLPKPVATDTGKKDPADGGVMEPASRAPVYQVTLSSTPPGARIFFDCVDQGSYTPKVVNMDGNQPVHVSLKKDGYYVYEIDFTPVRDAQPLLANLQPLGQHAAYVSFSLVGGGESPIIEIAGHRVCGQDNIDKYPIPAGVPVQIRARNSYTGAMAETTLTLQPDEWKQHLELVLGTGH